MPIRKLKWKRLAGRTVLVLFLLMNMIAALHAWRFTHFTAGGTARESATGLSFSEKLTLALTGVKNPRPENKKLPARPYETVALQSNKRLVCWLMHPTATPANGMVLVFHGYGGEKSGMLDKAYVLLDAGYDVLLVDFMGAGQSEGSATTVGYKEAEEVKTCYDYALTQRPKKLFLFGTSMGAAAVLKSVCDYNLKPAGIMIECPFGSLYKTVCNRFEVLHVPSFPMAGLLLFWGSVENGFNGFSYSPEAYAKDVHCPTLLMWGQKDDRVTRAEIDGVYNNLAGEKQLVLFPEVGHNNYLTKYSAEWTAVDERFMGAHYRRRIL